MSTTELPELSYEYLKQSRDGLVPDLYDSNALWQRNIRALSAWLDRCNLRDGRLLEVGCGSGRLQHIVPGYVGLDLDLKRADYFHSRFLNASALEMPFADNTFDGAWSIWVLEHIPDPGAMLAEMRRVVKPGGSIFLCVAYSVDSWISQGLHKRPWSDRDLTLRQRLTKLTIPLRRHKGYKAAARLSYRLIDALRYARNPGPTRLRFKPLTPNFETYWDYDADAVASIDAYRVALFFLSRGDTPLYPAGVVRSLLQQSQPQAFVVNKPAA